MIKKTVKNALAFFLGIFITLLFLEIFLRCLGWYQINRNLFTKITFKGENEVRVLSLGESMTNAGRPPYYPEQLQDILSKSLPNKKIVVFNEGVPSFNSKRILFNLEKNLDRYQPNIVTIMTGCNDFGSVKYEEFAGIKSADFLSKLKVYKLYKFLLKNIQEKLIKIAFAVPKDVDLVKLGNDLFYHNQINEAKDYFEKALQINPNNAEAYLRLAETSFDSESIDKRIWYYQQAIKIDPQNPQPYIGLANLYYMKGMDKQRLEILNQGLQINPYAYNLLMALATDYVEKNKIAEAINLINEAFTMQSEFKPKPLDIQLLAQLYKSQGRTKEAGEVLGLVIKSSEALAQNYIEIADILKKRGIIFVAVQYPMRDIFPLKTMLKETDAIFVDNEKSFKEKVAKYGPDEYFVDRFAGDFGHMTAEGHRIVAENIAEVMLKQIF